MGRAAAPDPTPFAYAQSPRRHVVRSIIISDSIVQQPANMTEGVANSNDADAAAQRASEQARLRKERREAKLKAGGSARLNKITGIGGRPQIDLDTTPPVSTTATPPPTGARPTAPASASKPAAGHEDPDEVDISNHYYEPQQTARIPRGGPAGATDGAEPAISEAALRQMMLGMDPNGGRQGQPGAGAAGEAPGEEDPIMKMMAQMMGGGAGGPGGLPGFPPGGAFPGMPGFPGQQQQVQKPDPYTSLWRVLHAVVALGLGLYIAILTPFTGTKAERDTDALSDEENEHRKRLFFWVFATAESLLLSTRFFLDKGRTPPTGIAWTVVGYLPQPFAGYASHALRYGGMFATVRADILACMFVLGVCSWWRV